MEYIDSSGHIEIVKKCGACGAINNVFGTTNPGWDDREPYDCATCHQPLGTLKCSNVSVTAKTS